MTRPLALHLSYDDLDALLAGAPAPEARAHVADCALCRTLLADDAVVIRELGALAVHAPAPGFADRVMSQVAVLSGVTASILWTATHRPLLAHAGRWLGSEALGWLWSGLQNAAATAVAQPGYGALRELAGSPGRLVATIAVASLCYLAGLLVLRRLMALPSHGVAHARA